MSAADAAYTMSHTAHEGEVSVPEPTAVGSMVFTYAICHFVVDLACVSTMLGAVSATLNLAGASGQSSPFAVFFAILLYDMLAFALQLPIGALLDRVDKNERAALVSFALITFRCLSGSFRSLCLDCGVFLVHRECGISLRWRH